MADMMDTLKGFLGDDAEDKIKNALSNFSQDDEQNFTESQNDYLSDLKSLAGKIGSANDSRSRLLLSLKPYMRDTRKSSIDNAIKILNLTRIAGLFK